MVVREGRGRKKKKVRGSSFPDEKVENGGSSFFRPRRSKIGGFFVLRARKIEEPPPSSKNPPSSKKSRSPVFRPIFDPVFGPEDRVRGSSMFDAEDRRLQIEKVSGSSAPKIEDDKVLRSFGFEDRRWRYSSKIEIIRR